MEKRLFPFSKNGDDKVRTITNWRIIHNVPTPFYHLSIAQELITHPELSGNIRTFLRDHQCAFFLGKTAPDVQTISGQPRESTHFFKVPFPDKKPAWEALFKKHSRLKSPADLPDSQAAFIAGYICHLQADQLWISTIFKPYFGLEAKWGHFYLRLYRHNVLRTYIDERIIQDLPNDTGSCLQNVQPNGWLPFASDESLIQWRDMLADQLQPEGNSRTAEVFADRMGVPVEELMSLLNSEERMEQEVFSHVPRHLLVEYRQQLILSNLALLSAYFS
jgi:hypothetical protein